MKSVLRICVVVLLTAGLFGQTSTPTSAKKKAAVRTSITAKDVQELKDALAAQQGQIDQLRQQLAQRDAAWQQSQQQLQAAQAAAAQAQSQASNAASQVGAQEQTVTALQGDVTDLKQNQTSTALSLQETQKNITSTLESPLAIHYKGITITPGGFLAAETVWRQHATGSDINTPFNSIPFPGASQYNMSEFFGSGRQSRVSMLAEGKLGSAKASGYVEADFLSAGITSNNNQSNSYSLRQRQAWAQAALNSGWTFTGGQMWSLVTETKTGVDNRTEALPMTIDPQYNVGFSWARQYGFRVAKDFGNKAWLAFSVEDSQATLGGHGASNNFLIGSQGTSGGLYNPTANYSFNPTPDFVFKTAFEPGWGHYEIFGVITDFRDRVFPCALTSSSGTCGGKKGANAVGAFNNNDLGGGIGANIRGTLAKKVDIGVHFLGGNGIGRYGSAGLADVIARPDGVLTPVRNYQALGTLEYHAKRLDIYSNAGMEYEVRQWYLNGKTPVGYGAPGFSNLGCYTEIPPAATTTTVATPPTSSGGSTGTTTVPVPGAAGTPLTGGFNPGSLKNCTGDTRNIWEGTIGFWYRLYSGPKGRLQFGPQYSYLVRNTWEGQGSDPSAKENMVLTSFRYYLP